MQTRVLIVEDNRTNLMMIEMLVRKVEGCIPVSHDDPVALNLVLEEVEFDIALIDYQMPGIDGINLIRSIRACRNYQNQPLVMLTADRDSKIRLEAIQAGAVEFLNKPLEPIEFRARLANLVRLSEAQRKLADKADNLRLEVEKATAELRLREEEIIHRLSTAAGYKDRETALHTIRMSRYSSVIAEALGFDAELCRNIGLAAQMHDIGKVGIRDSVLLKPGRLDDEERMHMNEHAGIGGSILAGSRSKLLQMAADIALTHHERWDGSGYPRGLSGENIPIVGRIAAIADVFDALTSERPYKAAWPVERAIAYVRDEAGRQFDPRCVAAFLGARPIIEGIRLRTAKESDPLGQAA